MMQQTESQQNRAGETKTTSVSVSKEFLELVRKYNLSPTEVFRRGIAISLCDQGVDQYKNPYNMERLRRSNEFLEQIRKFSEIRIKLTKVKQLLEELNNI